MKALLGTLLLAAAVPAAAGPAPASPLLGSWSVDLTRLPIPPEARPKSVTITYSDAGAGKWRADVVVMRPDGSKDHAESVYPLDGTSVPVTGNFEADTTAARLPEANVMIMALAKGGIPASTRIYAVAPDGKTMTETAVYFRDGKPVMRTNYFTRVK
ncbi:hypothetical protein DAH55_16145 [Sphingomonas koreensis]|uniref:hypothetical protein n=1 Tax=Sphingomonas koreensis TaxID=93064 RepID=UPI000833263C|nr:hypothetical protein [Sphingomonas koreensis]PJI89962.1 hypothetical protein BDW16_3283 [Sphingomonas koreensis]RSU62580.1 hypothetical protein DAH56_05080 [Sphingomonas koreensis]RSU65997.1 hypothetical protein DAH55_16145 [Sphingomonas koreensis]